MDFSNIKLTSAEAKLFYLETETEKKYISVSLWYCREDYSHYKNRRGYFVTVYPEAAERKEYNGVFYWVNSSDCFSGFKFFCGEIKRDSQKAFNNALAVANDVLPELLADVCRKNNINLNNDFSFVQEAVK